MSKESTEDTSQGMDRRKFLSVAGVAGVGTAALSGCSTDRIEKLVPYMVGDEDNVPGIATYYASTCTECPAGCSLHVKTREARAIKLEGNPGSPINRGRLCARGQAGLQGLYNPGRLNGPQLRNTDGSFSDLSWDDAIALLAERVGAAGASVAVVSGTGTGTFSDLLAAWVGALGGRLVRYQPFDNEALRAANQQVFGRNEVPSYDFATAEYILSFGADFLETWLGQVENQRGFAESHGFHDGHMAKHVYLGHRMDLTGMNADEWHATHPGSDAAVALAMANVILSERNRAPNDANTLRSVLAPFTPERAAEESGLSPETIRSVAREFASHPGMAVAGGIASQHRGATEVCAAVNILNYVAGNIGQTIHFGSGRPQGDGYGALEELAAAMDTGSVDVLILHEANPVHSVPRAAGFAERMAKVGFTVSTSSVMDDTAAHADLVLPNLHALERWDDLQPRDGVHALLQPVMMPVRDGKATGDVLLQVARAVGGPLAQFDAASFEVHLKDRWSAIGRQRGRRDFRVFWTESLASGGLFDEPAVGDVVRLAPGARNVGYQRPAFDGEGDLVFAPYPSSMLYDGRGANKPWLLENPDPVTKITWQSWIELHPDTARQLDIREGEVVQLVSPHGTIEAPVYPYLGIHPGVVATPLGLGHTTYGQYADGRGVNALDLLGGEDGGGFLPYLSTRVELRKTRRYQKLAKTEGNPRQLGRGIAEAMPFAAAADGKTVAEVHGGHHEVNTELEHEAIVGWAEAQRERTLRGDYAGEHPNWGMVIDLSRCTGCSACVTACYAENNIPTVGEREVVRGRELSWMRIERYFEGGEDGEPFSTRVVPMMCQHCDNAPCEPVCPVFAAYHTPDGLNAQVYNRCVGTRYCGNNCPYKVRYFNWLAYARLGFDDPLQLQLNPDVTVRARGIMEKCTFCIQRIRGAQNTARMEDRQLGDGEVVTACAQACPSGAIVFGDMNDPDSRVARAGQDHRGYHVLGDLNVRPSVTYLAKVQHGGEH